MVEPVPLFDTNRRTGQRPGADPAEPSARVVSLPLGVRRYGLADVARALYLSDLPIRAIIEKLRLLAAHDDMPLPRNPRFFAGRPINGPQSIHARSLWDAGEYDAWLNGRHPGAPAADLAQLPGSLREELRARAQQIAGAA